MKFSPYIPPQQVASPEEAIVSESQFSADFKPIGLMENEDIDPVLPGDDETIPTRVHKDTFVPFESAAKATNVEFRYTHEVSFDNGQTWRTVIPGIDYEVPLDEKPYGRHCIETAVRRGMLNLDSWAVVARARLVNTPNENRIEFYRTGGVRRKMPSGRRTIGASYWSNESGCRIVKMAEDMVESGYVE